MTQEEKVIKKEDNDILQDIVLDELPEIKEIQPEEYFPETEIDNTIDELEKI